ncbi:aminotransferase class V-fold PLP-dependent enzyme [Hyphococcus sp.]|uniref:aminotransferase class V-fold PLP-dependent enzyme n=1 Tax=Hyphococcus sp. TaxID=2038636 RepID=UPI003CCC184B
MLTRRQSLTSATAVALSVNAVSIASAAAQNVRGRSADDIARDEIYWSSIARAYRLDGRWIILNGGGNNPHPTSVVEALSRYDALSSSAPRPHNYVFQARIDDHRERLARLMNCAPEEVAITRNTTEGLNVVGWGFALNEGDEVLMSDVDEFYAGKIFEQRAKRHGVVVRQIELPLAPTARQIVQLFEDAMTPRTKLVVASHLADGWGYVLPIRELSELAHNNGAQLLADGALSFGHIPVSMKELGCDYYATSLHKWLNAPLGTGALYVRRDRLESLWPIYGTRREAGDIRKFEDIGTRCGPTIAAIGQALDFYEQLGPERKAARVRYLLSLVMKSLDRINGVRVITEPDERKRTGLARIVVEGMSGRDLTTMLREEFDIYTYGNSPGPNDGVYISPNVFNSSNHMSAFSNAIKEIAARS